MTGIYIHVPFCAKKCPYCDFYSVSFEKKRVESYVDAVLRNIEQFLGRQIEADSIYLGGGTPSLLTAEQVGKIVDAAKRVFEVKDAEVTLEANPCTVEVKKLEGYRRAGVNRLSFGIQSADGDELKRLGRLHDFERAQRAVNDAVKAGFDNISCDIMLATPGQSLESLKRSIDALVQLDVQHISAYILKIEPGTAFDCERIRKSAADDELAGDMYLEMVNRLEKAGFEQYEISNFAKKGFESRHNMKYWLGEQYIGIGPSSYSFFGGVRYHCERDVYGFIGSDVQKTVIDEHDTDPIEEYIMLGLRLKKGISIKKLEQLGADTQKICDKARFFEKAGLCSFDGQKISLTAKGCLVSNGIIGEFELLL